MQLLPEEGRIVIEVDDSRPEQAAALANGLAERLQRWVEERNAAQAGPDRILVNTLVPATAPKSPSPRFVVNTLAGLVLGLLLGFPLALLWDTWDDTLSEPADAASRLGLRVWPAPPPRETEGLEVLRHPSGGNAAAWQRLYTALRFPGPEGPARWRTLAVAGVRPGDLPPPLLANLGAAIAQDGSTVLLIDAGFAEPALHRPFGLPTGPGLGEWLQDGGEMPTTVATEQANLALLPAGTPLDAAAQAVALRRAARRLPALARMAETVLVRLPDLEGAPEGLFVAAEADGVVLTARAGHTRLRHVRRALEALQSAQARVLGLVLWHGGRDD